MCRCPSESFSSYDFDVFGYEIDVKTSRDVSAFLPESLPENDPDDDIVIMVWHRDNEDSLILLGWERLETLKSKAATQERYSGTEPEKLDHLAARPMNELMDLDPNTAHMNQKSENPFKPGDRAVRADEDNGSVAVVVEVLLPEKQTGPYGQQIDGEAVQVAFPSHLDAGPGDWREIHSALLASYCADQGIELYTCKHTNLKVAVNLYVAGDRDVKIMHPDPDPAIVVNRGTESGEDVGVVFVGQLGDETVPPVDLAAHCEKHEINCYSYSASDLKYVELA